MEGMACQEFAVLYTHQKTKKSKVWQDGILKSSVGGNKATLFDDRGQILDSIFVKCQIKPGDDLESERYLISVEDENTSETGCNDQPKNTTVSILTRNHLKYPTTSLRLPMGLKRKFSGFQPPRQVEKKVALEETATMVSPSHKITHSTFPSQFYDSSPLFSVPYEKREEANLFPGINRDAVTTNEGDPPSAASMVSIPCVDYHKEVLSRNHSSGSANTEYGKTQSQLDNGIVNSDYHVSSDGAVSQNIRSKAQIIALLKFKTALLSKEQKEFKAPMSGTTTSVKNLSLESECCARGLPLSELPRNTDVLLQQTVSPFLESISNFDEETCKSIQTLHSSEKPVQTKSRWDAYLPLCVVEELPNLAGHNDKNACDLQPVKKDLKEDSNVNTSECNEDHTEVFQLPASLENCISPVSESCAEAQLHIFVPTESSMNKESEIEVLSSSNTYYSDCINKTKIVACDLSESSKHAMIDTSKGFCHQSQNELCPMICEHVLDHSANKNLGDLDEQFPVVNFNLVDTVDFSETEDGESQANITLSQGSVSLEEKMETQLETVVQKNCELKAYCSEVKDDMLSAFSQDTGVNCNTGSQPVEFCDKISENTNKMEESGVTFHFLNVSRYPEPAVFENIKATNINHLALHSDSNSGDLIVDNNEHCTQLEKPNVEPYIRSTSNIYFKNDEVGGDNSQLCSTGICDNMKLASSTENNCGFPRISEHNITTLEKSYDLGFKPVAHFLKDEETPEESEISNNTLENAAVDSSYKSTEDKEKDFVCLNSSVVGSSSFPMMENSFSLLRSLTEHSTALESLHVIEESTDVLFQGETLTKKVVSSGESEARQSFFEVSYTEDGDGQIPCSSLKTHSSLYNDIEKPTAPIRKEVYDQHPFGVGDSEPKAVEFQGYQVKGSAASEIMVRESCSHLRWDPHADMVDSDRVSKNSHYFSAQELSNTVPLGFIEMPSTQWIPLQTSDRPFSPKLTSKGTADWQEQTFLSTSIPESVDSTQNFFKMEESNSPEEMSVFLSTVRTQTPVVTVPVDEEFPDSQFYSSTKDCEQDHQSFGFPEVSFYDTSKVLGPEDRICEMSVHEKCTGERQGVFTESAFPNVSEQKKQSKWQKYQNTTQCDLRTQNSSEMTMTDDFQAESVLGMPLDDAGESQSDAVNESPPDSGYLQIIKSMLCKQQRNFSSQDSVSEEKKLSLHLNQIFSTEEAPKVLGQLNCHNITRHTKNICELFFPSAEIVKCADVPKRQIYIPVVFQSPAHYKQVFTAALTEHLNILLFELSQKLHKALGKVDISFYTSVTGGFGLTKENSAPLCKHKIATKLLTVRKEGRNKGRLFYACDAPKADRCDFFKWVDDLNVGQIESGPSVVFHDMKSVGIYLRSQNISLYEECQLSVRKAFDIERKRKLKKFNNENTNFDSDCKNKLYLKLKQKELSCMFSKDDLWVVSKTLTFETMDTFIACSVFFGPSSSNEIELVPLKGYSPSNWRSNMIVHALLVCNASTELTTLRNLDENFNSATLPIMQHLLTNPYKDASSSNRVKKQKFKSPALCMNTVNSGLITPEMMIILANRMIETFQLNKDQAMALIHIGSMMTSAEIDAEMGKPQSLPVTIIHGVFGSGKSYLLAIVILFLVQIFETNETTNGKNSLPWKVLLSSSTNVAVDRVLLCLLDLGFEEFIRVGSIRKIAKPVLPHSLHAGTGPENEQLKELLALMKGDLTPAEKIYVKKTIQHHKLGTNKARLQQVRVVGATCAACPFPCMKNLKFHIVVLDECSQMTEPASFIPIARFSCEKLILVGDPKQLPPTIQGSECAHGNGLEQTLFDRLCLMGHEPILLRTQYRCHPAISAITNDLFYGGNLMNGISEMDRNPLVDWLPTLCFYNVNGFEQVERDNSFHNMAESVFIVKLIQFLITSGIDGSMIGVIALYKSQMNKIYALLGAVHSDTSQIKAVQVSTVDAFQGAEKEIIVLSCVRTRHVGFIDSERRVNVALTRGKRHLLIVGNLNCLRKNKLWGNVIQHCAGRKNGLQHVDQFEQQLNDILNSEKKKYTKGKV